MPRPIDEFVAVWDALSDSSTEVGWCGIPVAGAGECELMAARRFPGNEEALLACFPTASPGMSDHLPEGKGFEVVRVDPFDDGKTWIALSRKESGSPELFAEMVGDVAGVMDAAAPEGDASVLKAMLRRVRMWQHFMSRGKGLLSSEAELGLAGELFFMMRLLDAGVSCESVLGGWVGPDNAPQDFLFGDGAIEVKATMSSSGFPVKIGSLEQLDDAVASPLFLAVVKFATGDGGMRLPEMVAEVEQRIQEDPGALDLLRERLLVAGYTEAHADRYSRRFDPNEWRVFCVSEGFPRLTSGVVPVGVMRTVYEIDLKHAGGFLCDFAAVLSQLGATE